MSTLKFKTIKTDADSITVSLDNGFTKLTFTKDDFPKLLSEGINFDKYDCKNYKNIEITGNKSYKATFSDENNSTFIEESKSYVDAIHLLSSVYLDQVYKDDKSDNAIHIKIEKNDWKNPKNTFLYDYRFLEEGELAVALYNGLSSFKCSNGKSIMDTTDITSKFEFFDLSNVETLWTKFSLKNFSGGFSSNFVQRINKLPQFTWEDITSFYKAFTNFSSLEEIPNLTFNNADDATEAFEGCTSLKKVGNIDLTNVTSTYMFKDSSIEKLGYLYVTDFLDKSLDSVLYNCNVKNIDFVSGSCNNILKYITSENLSLVTEDPYIFSNRDTYNNASEISNLSITSVIKQEESLNNEIISSNSECKVELNFVGEVTSDNENFTVKEYKSITAEVLSVTGNEHFNEYSFTKTDDGYNLAVTYNNTTESFESIFTFLITAKYIGIYNDTEMACTSHIIYQIKNNFNSDTYNIQVIEE